MTVTSISTHDLHGFPTLVSQCRCTFYIENKHSIFTFKKFRKQSHQFYVFRQEYAIPAQKSNLGTPCILVRMMCTIHSLKYYTELNFFLNSVECSTSWKLSVYNKRFSIDCILLKCTGNNI